MRSRALGGLLLGLAPHGFGIDAPSRQSQQDASRPIREVARAAFWVLAASGMIALAYEVVWARILAILFDSSIYGFVLMLATVLFGIAVGGALGGALVGWRTSSRLAGLTLGWLEIGIGLAAVLALVAFGGAYDLLITLRDSGPNLFARLLRTDPRLMAALCVTTVLPAALMMGATFPIGARLWAAGADRLGQRLGGVYAANVSGAILGSLLGGFVLVPILGAHSSLMLLAATSVLIGVAMLMVVSRGAVPIVAGVLALGAIAWGASRTPLHETVFRERFPDMQLVDYWEGLENTVSVALEPDGVQRLFTNSRSQTNDSPDLVRYHRIMGHLAAVLSPRDGPRTLVVGIGGGATPGAIAQHSGAEVDLIELSEAVVAAAPHFSVVSQDVLAQPNVHLQIDDGRNFLLRNRRLYDVITADVVPPFDAGATNLYSVEYFTLASRALAPDGIMVQWASPGSAYEHELIVRSFLQVFPHVSLWLTGDLLVGSMTPQQLQPRRAGRAPGRPEGPRQPGRRRPQSCPRRARPVPRRHPRAPRLRRRRPRPHRQPSPARVLPLPARRRAPVPTRPEHLPGPHAAGRGLAVVDELQRHRPVAILFRFPQQLDRGLQLVFVLARDAHGVALNLRLELGQTVANQFGDLAREVLRQPLAQRRGLPHGAFRGLLDASVVEDLGRQLAFHRLLQQHVAHRLERHFTRAVQLDAAGLQLDRGARVLEVVPGVDFPQGLVDRVNQLLAVEL